MLEGVYLMRRSTSLVKQVRARSASKGRFVHVVLSRLGWRCGGDVGEGTGEESPGSSPRFCLCVGDDVSDEDMFLALKVSGLIQIQLSFAGYSARICRTS